MTHIVLFSNIWNMINFIFGLIFGGAGFWFVKDAYHINHQILFVGWAERKWGPGSGTTFYTVLGVGLIIFGFFTAIGKVDIATAAFGASQKTQSSSLSTDPNGGFIIQPIRPPVTNGAIAQ